MREPWYYVGAPIRSLQTILRVLSKTRSNQPPVVPDGIYGTQTRNAVTAFQRQEMLPITGRTDNETWMHLIEAYEKESALVLPAAPLEIIWQPNDKLRPGDRSLHLYVIQAMFVAIGEIYSNAPKSQVTGVHDESSVSFTKWLQEKTGRPVTGILDQNDWLYLTKLYRQTAGDGRKRLNVIL